MAAQRGAGAAHLFSCFFVFFCVAFGGQFLLELVLIPIIVVGSPSPAVQ
jgi:hypothetical protein